MAEVNLQIAKINIKLICTKGMHVLYSTSRIIKKIKGLLKIFNFGKRR